MVGRTRWLDRRIAAPGPHLCLVLSQKEFDDALLHCKVKTGHPYISSEYADASTHFLTRPDGGAVALVALGPEYERRTPIEVAGLLVHEAVHVWQEYCLMIGEKEPGSEQEAYAIQSIAQELMAEFDRRMRLRWRRKSSKK